ncbi:MAG: THUMP domain-containing protein [Nitrososphaerota archaeon]
MTRLLALLSGEFTSLALSELKSILCILYGWEPVESLTDRLAYIDADIRDAEKITSRSAYTKSIIAPIIYAPKTDISSRVEVEVSELLLKAKSFAVRALRLGGVRCDRVAVERWLGNLLIDNYPGLRVDLSTPDLTVHAYISEKGVVAGPLLSQSSYRELEARRPGRRVFRHPSSLMPRLARCMVNLTRVRPGGWIIDPFAGTGSIPIEAAFLGYRVIPIELKRWIARGCLQNLGWVGLRGKVDVICGDATSLPLRGFYQGVATDPPYGRSTKLSDRNLRRLYLNAFSAIAEILERHSRVVTAIPQQQVEPSLLEEIGLRLLEQHPIRVHSSLTRVVCVYSLGS